MKRFICLILAILLITPFLVACQTGLQGNVKITIHYLDGNEITVSGHREYGAENNSKSIFSQIYGCLGASGEEQVGKVVVYKYKNGNTFDTEQIYKLENGAHIEIYETIQNKRYQLRFRVTCPGDTTFQKLTKFYDFGDKFEYTTDIENLLTFETVPENYDRYALEKWQIVKIENGEEVLSYDFNFNDTFNEKYDAYFESAKTKNEYGEYVMDVEAVYKPNTYTAVLHFEHDGVKSLNSSVAPVSITVPFTNTNFDISIFQRYVTEERIDFVGFSTKMNENVPLESNLDKSFDGTTINLYAIWYRYKIVKIDFLNGKGAIDVAVYEDRYANYYYVNPVLIQNRVPQDKLERLLGFGENKDSQSVILNFYKNSREDKVYYPIFY